MTRIAPWVLIVLLLSGCTTESVDSPDDDVADYYDSDGQWVFRVNAATESTPRETWLNWTLYDPDARPAMAEEAVHEASTRESKTFNIRTTRTQAEATLEFLRGEYERQNPEQDAPENYVVLLVDGGFYVAHVATFTHP